MQESHIHNLSKSVIACKEKFLPDAYEYVFNPNLCHVCKSRNTGNLITCRRCHMVYYCKEKHKDAHYDNHDDICQVISERIKTWPRWDRREGWKYWMGSRKALLKAIRIDIKERLDRSMRRHEEQIILSSKFCLICYKEEGIYCCERCFSVNYCRKHADDFRTIHGKEQCYKLTILLNIDIQKICDKMIDLDCMYKHLYSFEEVSISTETNITNMYKFFTKYSLTSQLVQYWSAVDYVMTDCISGPLTIYFGITHNSWYDIEFPESNFVIHIVGVNYIDDNSTGAWEVLFHISDKFITIVIVYIGPHFDTLSVEINCCNICKRAGKRLILVTVPLLYYKYLLYSPYMYKAPSVIACFRTDIKGGDEWTKSLEMMTSRKAPIFLIYSNKNQAENDIEVVKILTCDDVEPIYNFENNFHSYLPYRDFTDGNVYLRNQHLVVYPALRHIHSSKQSRDKDDKSA